MIARVIFCLIAVSILIRTGFYIFSGPSGTTTAGKFAKETAKVVAAVVLAVIVLYLFSQLDNII